MRNPIKTIRLLIRRHRIKEAKIEAERLRASLYIKEVGGCIYMFCNEVAIVEFHADTNIEYVKNQLEATRIVAVQCQEKTQKEWR